MKCLECKSETKNPKFCSKSCAASFNNKSGKYNRRKPEGVCRNCSSSIITRRTYCDNCIDLFSDCPPRKSRTFPTGLEGPCQDPLVEGRCHCGNIIQKKSKYCKSCSIKISAKIKSEKNIILWLNGEWRGGTNYGLSEVIRNYLLTSSNFECSKCGFNKRHPDDGRSILEINHIDGDGTNHSPQNLEVLCPNCHSLTSTYRGRNIGKGRPIYYLRVNAE